MSLTIEKWRSPSEAICGRWVMHSTWRALRQLAQPRADRARRVAADPGVDLVEHERRAAAAPPLRALAPGAGAHDREHHPRELAAGGDLAQRPRRDPGVRRDQELDGVASGRPGLARAQRDLEGCVGHRQRGELLAHAALEQRRRGLAGATQREHLLLEHRERAAVQLAGLLQRVLGPGELVAAGTRGLRVLEHALDAAAVLAHQPLDRRQTLFDPVQAELALGGFAWLRALGIYPQLGGEIVGLDAERAHALGEPVQPGIDALQSIETGAGLRQSAADPGAVGTFGAERLGGDARGGAQRVGAAQALAPREQLVVLPLVGLRRVDLGELELEQVELALARAGELAQLLQALLQAAHLGICLGARPQPQRLLGAAQLVEHPELRGGERQLAMLVLAVEGQQRAAEIAQLADGRRAPVQIRARASVGAHPSRQHDLLGVHRQSLGELLGQRGGQLEDTLDICLLGTGPHDAGACAPAEQQIERVGEHGLAGTGLPGEHVQPGRQAQLRPLDQQQVLDAQLRQHRAGVAVPADGSRDRRRTALAGSEDGGHERGHCRRRFRLTIRTVTCGNAWRRGSSAGRALHVRTRHGCQRQQSDPRAAERAGPLPVRRGSAGAPAGGDQPRRAPRHAARAACW